MADSSSRASSPEPGEAAPRGRIVQLKASARSSNSLDRQSLEASRASPAYNSHPSAWRGSPPRSRVPRPYAGAGRGYFKRPQLSYDQPAPYARERVFSRSRGRSVSRSPSRASQRSRSPSPRSPKSPQQRSRSRSRSFSPRGHRTFSNWERGGRAAAAVQYAAGRGGRGAGGFDGRPRGRERDSWSRGGGRGGGRYATYRGGGGSRFYPKEVRYKPAEEVRYKPAAPMPPRRSMSRDRGSNEGGASYRDRQRDYREYEPAYRARREMSHRSLVRTASFSSEYYRDSEPSASAEEGEEKPEEFHERSGGSHTPSEAGSTDRDMTSATDSNWKRASLAAALPPRSMAGDSYVSYRKGASSPNARPYDEDRPPVFKRENTASVRIMRDDTRQSARSSPPSEPVEERELKRSTGHRTPFADANDTPKEQVPAEPTGRYMSPEEIAADGESKRFSPTPTAAAVKSEEAHDVPEQTTDVTKSSDYRQEQTARAIKSGDGAEKAAFKDGETLKDANDDIEMDKTEIQQNLAVKSPDALVKTEDEVPMHKEGGSSVDQRIDQRTPSSYQTKQNESCKEVVSDPAMSPHGGNEEMETKAHAEHVRGDDNSQKGSTQDNDVDMDAVSSQKVVDANDLSSARRTAALSAEVKNVDARDDKDSRQEASQIEKVALSQQPPHESSTLSAKAEEVKPTDAISSLVPEDTEVEEGEMPDSGKEDLKTADSNVFKPQEVSAALSHTVSSVPSEERNEADVAKVSTAPERDNGRERRARLERSRTDPSTDAYKDNGKPRSTSFSSFGVPNGTRREEGSSREMKAFSQAKSELTLARGKEHGVHRNQHDPPSSVDQPSSQHGDRSVLDRRASFSTLSERGHYSSSEARGVVGFTESADGSKTARASSSFSNKSSPPKPYGTFGNNVDGRRRGLHDELKREDAAKRELLRAGSMDSMFSKRSRTQEVRETAASASNSPSRRAIGGTRPREELPTSPREELPTLPEIPLPPSGATPENSSPGVMGEGTPTKRLRPRLGWGQGLVASSPPQPAKRPRIGWGQGLILQTTRKKENTSGAVSESAASVGAIIASPTKAGEATVENSYDGSSVVKSEPSKIESVIEIRSEKEMPVAEERILATSTPEKERQPTPVAVESSSVTAADDEAGTNEDTKVEDSVEMEQDAVAPAKPSKEEILSTIDILDSDIAGVKKQMKSLQRTIASAEVKQVASSVTDMEVDSADELDPSAVTSKQCSDVKSSLSSPTDASNLAYDQTMLTSPVKVAVDSRFVELLAGVFSENLRKTTAANEQLPKRIEQGQLATKIYHQPSDYAFYQANIDRGSALSDRVRMKVRKRNCARHEYMKKLARDYVDLKKSWKTGVKRMEKDRKRQDKLRLKQLQKQKLKSLSESGPIRTTNTNHQSPHVQVLVAAEKAAEAAGGEGVVRTSSRLTNNSSADLENNDLEKIEQAKAQALIDQEVRKKRLKNALSTVIPDMLITPAERQQRYFTRFVNGQSCMADGLVADWKQKEKAEMKVNPWNDLEKCIYMDKFLQFPKNFPRISSFLRNKTTGDVIAFYYRTKKVADYKVFLREQQLRRRGAGSKNTWSCWNLAACAAICLGVQFPEHVGKLLLHPSNFRSHQASDNILNSAGAQRILRTSSAKAESGSTATKSTGTVEGVSALEMISGSDHTPTVRPSMSEVGVQIDDFVSSGDSDTSDEEKFNLYTQQLEKFVAGQQRPFLVDYAALLSDNSYSTGYEVSTLSIEERLKKYPTPSKELESTVAAAMLNNPSNAAQDSKGKQQGSVVGSNGNLKIGGPHLTKKELKQQRKMKKMHEGTGSAAASPTSNLALLQPGGNAIGERTGNHGRKKSSVGSSSTPGAMPGARNTPRISIPGDEKAAQSGKKTSRGAGTPGTRRNSHHPQTSSANASPMPSVMSGTSASTVSIAAPLGGAAKKGAGTPNATARSATSSAAVSGSSAAAPAKRVVQKWTDGEKADFLKYFSQYGKDWATLTDNIPTKTAAQIKNYYQNYKNRLNLQDILKRRIENAAASGGAKGAAHSTTALASTAASGNMVTSPRSAAAGLMSGTLRQMGRPVDLPGSLSVGMPSGSMAMSASDNNLSFQAALNAAQPGLHGVNVLSELSANQFGMQSHPDQQQQQQSRDMMNTNPERYLKLLNMQHQLQIMQFQQQQKPQGVGSESAGAGSNNSPYHEGQMNAGLYQFSRQQQQQHSVPPQHMSLQALQQMGLQGHSQAPAHSQMVQHSMQQQQPRGSFAEMGHPSGMYQSMNPMQTQHPQALTSAAQMGMSPTNSQQYDRQVDTSVNAAADGRIGATRDSAGSSSSVMRHDASQRVMMNMGMMNNAAGGNGSAMAQAAPSGSPHQPPLPPSRSMAMETGRPPKVDSRQSAWRSSPVSSAAGVPTTCSVSMKPENPTASSAPPKGREALAPPVPPPIQPVRSRMSFSSILNESESPREDATPRGNGSMVIRQQESPRVSQQQREDEQQLQRDQQQQLQQRQPAQLHLEHARAMPPTSAAELARSPVSAPSPTAHLLPRRSSVPTPHNRMGLMSSLLNVPSPERRTATAGHQSPLMHQQQQMQRQVQSGRYYETTSSSAGNGTTPSRSSVVTMVSGMPTSSTMSSAMSRSSPSEKMASAANMGNYTGTSSQMAVALSRSGSGSSTSSAVSAGMVATGDSRGQQLQQQQMWNYAPQMGYEEAEILKRRAQIAEEEAARAKAAAAQALQEAQKARQQALDMAANMARYNSAMQHQQSQQHQTQQHQSQHQQQAQQQQFQQYQQQLQAQQAQQMQQQHDYHQQHQAQQLHQQHMQQQALHHHLQLIQHQQQQQQRTSMPPSDMQQQQMNQQQQPPREQR